MPVPTTVPDHLDAIEARLFELLPRLTPPSSTRGRPEILPGALLWAGLLVCLLRGQPRAQAVWRLLAEQGLWHYPRIPVGAEAVRVRLRRAGPGLLQDLFTEITAELTAQSPGETTLAPFAAGVYAIDESTLDGVARTLPALRSVPAGDNRLLPGKLSTVFDVRRQLFTTVQPTDVPRQNEKVAARDLVATVPKHSLLLMDLGYFSFPWLDALTAAESFYVSRERARTSVQIMHVLVDQPGLREELVWLGARRADKARFVVRRITVTVGTRTWTYLTNVLDPTMLSAAEVVALYGRRWDIELAFKLLKRELTLHLLWSAAWEQVLTQVWGALIIAQVALSLRARIAERAGVTVEQVSLPLVLRDAPLMVRDGKEVVSWIASLPVVKGGYVRPSRRVVHTVPEPTTIVPPPPDLPYERTPRYAGRKCGPGRTDHRPSLPPTND